MTPPGGKGWGRIVSGLARDFEKRVNKAAAEGLDAAGREVVGVVKERFLSGQALNVRSGHLRRSIGHETDTGALTVKVGPLAAAKGGDGTPIAYAAIHEFGGTIKPKRGKWLTIPSELAMTPAGVPRYPSARDVPGLRFQPIDGSRALLVKDRKGRRARSEVWYYLVRSVTMPARPYLRPAASVSRNRFQRTIENHVSRALA